MRSRMLIGTLAGGLALLGCAPGRAPAEDLAGPDLAGPDLAGVDLGAAPPMASIDLDTLYQNCRQPAADPLLLKGRMTVRNVGGTPLGPIVAREGALFDRDGVRLATFELVELNLGTVPPDITVAGRSFEKRGGTLMPAMGCDVIKCNAPVRVEVVLTGPNVPADSKARSGPYHVDCD